MKSLIQKGLSATLVGVSMMAASMGAQATGMPLTLPTANLNAKSTFNFSDDATYYMDGLGVKVSALGNTKQVTGGETLSFNMPVTEVSVGVSLLPPALTPIAGEAMGSALAFTRAGSSGFALANFGMDFKRNVLQADFITSSGTTKSMDIFNFQVDQGLKISMNGGLSLTMNMDNMFLTNAAATSFGAALNLPQYAKNVLTMMDFGSLAVAIDPSLRFGVSDKAFTANALSAVPEAPQAAMMLLGLVGLAAISHRRRRD